MKKIILTVIVLFLTIVNIMLFRDYYMKNIENKNLESNFISNSNINI